MVIVIVKIAIAGETFINHLQNEVIGRLCVNNTLV
jgi:hypothetical protein